MPDLLPWNATPQERALSETVARVSDVGAPLRDLWNPDDCPPELLAWLAWAFSVDEWDPNWTDAQKRAFIKSSVEVHRHKGTIGAVRDALAALEYRAQVQEWFNQSPAGDPFTFRLILTVGQVGISQTGYAALFALVDRVKNLRSHLSEIALRVRSEAGPYLATVSGLGAEVAVTKYVPPILVFSDTTFVLS